MTILVYNDVVMRDCELLAFNQTIEYDPSDTDQLINRFHISVASSVVAVRNYSSPTDSFGVDTPLGYTGIQKAHDLHARLSESRKDFWFLVDNCVDNERHGVGVAANILDQPLLIATGDAYEYTKEIYTVGAGEYRERVVKQPKYMAKHPFSVNSDTNEYGAGEALLDKSTVLDCDNGPKPRNVKIDKIIGGRSLRVQFEIEVCRKIRKADFSDTEPVVSGVIEGSGSTVLSNRWYVDESKDDNWLTTRSLQGTLRVANKDVWPHAMRYLCMPSLLRGYQRISQAFVDDPTGLVLKYRIDDRQAHAAPPWPAIKWSGHHAETGSGPNGTIKTGEFHIRLQGPPGVDKQQLLGAAGKVAVNRLYGWYGQGDPRSNPQTNTSTILKNASVVDVLDQPIIELRMQVTYTDEDFKQLALRLKKMGKPIGTLRGDAADDPYLIDGYDPEVWPVPLAYDSESPAGIFACYLQHPSSVWHDVPNDMPVPTSGSNNDNYARPSNDPSKDATPDGTSPNSIYDRYPNRYHVSHNIPDDADSLARGSSYSELYYYPYSYVELQNSYVINNGYAQLPLSSADPVSTGAGYNPTAAIVKVHANTAKRILRMVASRDGKPPVIPNIAEETTDHNGIREVLGSVEITAKAPDLQASGTGRRFAIELRYEYLLDRAPTAAEKLRTGSVPWDAKLPADNWINLATYLDGAGQLQ